MNLKELLSENHVRSSKQFDDFTSQINIYGEEEQQKRDSESERILS